jgi:hypothetical protein
MMLFLVDVEIASTSSADSAVDRDVRGVCGGGTLGERAWRIDHAAAAGHIDAPFACCSRQCLPARNKLLSPAPHRV